MGPFIFITIGLLITGIYLFISKVLPRIEFLDKNTTDASNTESASSKKISTTTELGLEAWEIKAMINRGKNLPITEWDSNKGTLTSRIPSTSRSTSWSVSGTFTSVPKQTEAPKPSIRFYGE